MPTFILSDGSVNSYGFRVRTSGIELSRFHDNPVMLGEHINGIDAVLGRWTNVRVESDQLLADDEFDTEDAAANKIAGKVSRGFIKGASIGITFNPEFMERQPDGSWELTRCELMEASICAVPSNPKALKLYAEDTHRLMSEADVKLSITELQGAVSPFNNIKNQQMKKVVLTLAALTALGIQERNTTDGVDADAINDGVAKLKSDLEKAIAASGALKTANEKMQAELNAIKTAKANSLIETAITDGKLSATEKESWLEMAATNYELAEKTLSGIAGKKSLAATLNNPAPSAAEVKSEEDFQKLSLADQLTWKEANPEAYKKLFA